MQGWATETNMLRFPLFVYNCLYWCHFVICNHAVCLYNRTSPDIYMKSQLINRDSIMSWFVVWVKLLVAESFSSALCNLLASDVHRSNCIRVFSETNFWIYFIWIQFSSMLHVGHVAVGHSRTLSCPKSKFKWPLLFY